MRLVWLSNAPWTPTGYGQQTGYITPRLNQAGQPTAVISNFGYDGGAINWNGVTVYGKSYHPMGMDIMYGHAKTWNAAAILTLLDLQVMDRAGLRGFPWIAWTPCDHQTIPPVIWNNLQYADFPITLSKHLSAELDKADKEHFYIPCAVDTKIYKPLDSLACREELHLPTDKFIIGMVAMNKGNPSRKAFHQNIAAFAALKRKHSDVALYLHTGDGTRGYEVVDLIPYLQALGLSYGYEFQDGKDKDVIFCDQYGLALGYPQEMLAKMYSSLDVLTAVTMGEGFGVPIIEAQACGTPVIVGDWTSMPELLFSGWKVERSDAEPIFTPLLSWHYLPRPAAIAEKMEAAYQMRGNQDYRKRARAGVKEYDVENVMSKYWLPTLAQIEERLAIPVNSVLDKELAVLR